METLGDALPAVMKHVREIIMPAYIEIGPAGSFVLALMNQSLSVAERAMIEGDLTKMIMAYEDLKSYPL